MQFNNWVEVFQYIYSQSKSKKLPGVRYFKYSDKVMKGKDYNLFYNFQTVIEQTHERYINNFYKSTSNFPDIVLISFLEKAIKNQETRENKLWKALSEDKTIQNIINKKEKRIKMPDSKSSHSEYIKDVNHFISILFQVQEKGVHNFFKLLKDEETRAIIKKLEKTENSFFKGQFLFENRNNNKNIIKNNKKILTEKFFKNIIKIEKNNDKELIATLGSLGKNYLFNGLEKSFLQFTDRKKERKSRTLRVKTSKGKNSLMTQRNAVIDAIRENYLYPLILNHSEPLETITNIMVPDVTGKSKTIQAKVIFDGTNLIIKEQGKKGRIIFKVTGNIEITKGFKENKEDNLLTILYKVFSIVSKKDPDAKEWFNKEGKNFLKDFLENNNKISLIYEEYGVNGLLKELRAFILLRYNLNINRKENNETNSQNKKQNILKQNWGIEVNHLSENTITLFKTDKKGITLENFDTLEHFLGKELAVSLIYLISNSSTVASFGYKTSFLSEKEIQSNINKILPYKILNFLKYKSEAQTEINKIQYFYFINNFLIPASIILKIMKEKIQRALEKNNNTIDSIINFQIGKFSDVNIRNKRMNKINLQNFANAYELKNSKIFFDGLQINLKKEAI